MESTYHNRSFGMEGEQQGVDYLKRKRYKIIARNVRTSYGEIDVIALHREYLVFIEIKRRSSGVYGAPFEAVNRGKQARIAKSAISYIKEQRIKEKNIRFDVLSIGPEAGQIELIENAFSVPSYYTF